MERQRQSAVCDALPSFPTQWKQRSHTASWISALLSISTGVLLFEIFNHFFPPRDYLVWSISPEVCVKGAPFAVTHGHRFWRTRLTTPPSRLTVTPGGLFTNSHLLSARIPNSMKIVCLWLLCILDLSGQNVNERSHILLWIVRFNHRCMANVLLVIWIYALKFRATRFV